MKTNGTKTNQSEGKSGAKTQQNPAAKRGSAGKAPDTKLVDLAVTNAANRKTQDRPSAGVVSINGNAFELDIFELETAQRFETAVEQVYVKAEAVKQAADGEMKISEAIRSQCETVFDFFDSLFGKGSARKIFGARVNLIQCIDAFESAIHQIEDQKKVIEARLKKTTGTKNVRTGRGKA